jgi:hypothetical protein
MVDSYSLGTPHDNLVCCSRIIENIPRVVCFPYLGWVPGGFACGCFFHPLFVDLFGIRNIFLLGVLCNEMKYEAIEKRNMRRETICHVAVKLLLGWGADAQYHVGLAGWRA